jgi:hypothetical protein
MAPSHILQIFLRVTIQNQVRIAQWVVVNKVRKYGEGLHERLEKEEECECPWVDSKGKVRETAYCQYLLEKNPMMCLKQKLFDQNGEVDEDALLYAHTQDKPRLELTEKIEADFYTQDVAGAKPQEPPENKTPVATKITGKMILEAIRQMDAEERRELTRVLFA